MQKYVKKSITNCINTLSLIPNSIFYPFFLFSHKTLKKRSLLHFVCFPYSAYHPIPQNPISNVFLPFFDVLSLFRLLFLQKFLLWLYDRIIQFIHVKIRVTYTAYDFFISVYISFHEYIKTDPNLIISVTFYKTTKSSIF